MGIQSPAGGARGRLATKIILAIAGLLLAIAVGVSALTFLQARGAAYADLERRGQAIADTLNYTFEVLLGQEALTNLQRLTEDSATIQGVRRVQIAARNRNVLASSDKGEINLPSTSPQMIGYLDAQDWQTKTYLTDAAELIIIKPLRGPQFAGGMNSANIIGAVQVTLDRGGAEQEARGAALRLLAISLGGYAVLFGVLWAILRALVVGPVRRLAGSAQRFRAGERSVRADVKTNDEIGVLSGTFNDMAQEVEGLLAGLEGQVAARTGDLERERARLAAALADLQASSAERRQLAATVQHLSAPVINVYRQIVLLPLIGSIDAARADQIQATLLQGIAQHGARLVILDLTGVPVVDGPVAMALARMPRAAQLLGTEVIIVGVTPEVAQSIVSLGVDLSAVRSFADLQSGVQYALRRLGLMIAARR
ncbi:MAG TPA: STAS domain-containing protein [Herpetosiphonaceae bacterium]